VKEKKQSLEAKKNVIRCFFFGMNILKIRKFHSAK